MRGLLALAISLNTLYANPSGSESKLMLMNEKSLHEVRELKGYIN